MPRINRTYLMDRVNTEVAKRCQIVNDEARTHIDRIKTDFVDKTAPKNVGTALLKRRAKINKLKEQLEVLEKEQEKTKANLLENLPWLSFDFGLNGKIRWFIQDETQAYYRHERSIVWPEPLKLALKKVRDTAASEQSRLRVISTKFTDKVMMGEATFEDFTALLEALDG